MRSCVWEAAAQARRQLVSAVVYLGGPPGRGGEMGIRGLGPCAATSKAQSPTTGPQRGAVRTQAAEAVVAEAEKQLEAEGAARTGVDRDYAQVRAGARPGGWPVALVGACGRLW